MRKSVIGCVLTMNAFCALSAVTPLARWAGDFTQTTKGDFTLVPNGNVVAEDGSTITIADTSTTGVTVNHPKTLGFLTIAVRYAGLRTQETNSILLTISASGKADESGLLLSPTWQDLAIWQGKHWANANGAPAAWPVGESGCFAYAYHPSGVDATKGSYVLATRWHGPWALLNKWGNQGGGDKDNIDGFAVGGPCNPSYSSTLKPQKGMVIREIAVFPGCLTAAELDECFPSGETHAPVPLVCFAADAGVETNEDGVVTKWVNQGALPNEDVTPSGNAGTASATAITLAQHDTFGPVVRFDKTDFLTSQTSGTLGLGSGDSVYTVAVVDYSLVDGEDEHGLFCVYPDNEPQAGSFPQSGYSYMTLGGMYYQRWQFQFGSSADKGGNYGSHNLSFGKGISGKRLISSVVLSNLSYGYVGGGHSVSYGYPNGGPLTTFRAGKLRVGAGIFAQSGLMRGDLAELRIYSQPFSAAMRFAVEGELAAKYGLDLQPSAETNRSETISAATLAGCFTDPRAFGDVPEGGEPVSTIPASATSGGLTVAFAETPSEGSGTLVYVGNNGLAGAEKVWCVVGGAGARALPLTLTFDAATAASVSGLSLYVCDEATGNWRKVVGVPEDGTLVAAIPAGWSNGRYRFSSETTAVIPAAWFRADAGVTLDGSGQVVKWANQGTMGSVLDVAPVAGEAGVTVGENALFGTCLHFDGASLEQISTTPTTFGIQQKVGGTYFVVVDMPDSTKTYPYQMVFGTRPDGDNSDWSKSFSLEFNTSAKYFMSNFFGYQADSFGFYSVPSCKPGKHLVSLTAAYDFVFARGQVSYVDGVVASNATVNANKVQGYWQGKVAPGYLRIGADSFEKADRTKLRGDIAELRIYSHPLSMTEQAAVELELAAKYNLPVKTVGSVDSAAVAAHGEGSAVIGAEAFRGPQVTGMKTDWTDGALRFAFKENPPLPPETAAEGAGVKSLTYVGSDGGTAAFVPRSPSSSVQVFGRTWYVASACPTYGGVLAFACDTSDAAEWKYRLSFKANGAEAFVRLAAEPVVGDGQVTFTFETLSAGTYRLQRSPANIGFSIIVR